MFQAPPQEAEDWPVLREQSKLVKHTMDVATNGPSMFYKSQQFGKKGRYGIVMDSVHFYSLGLGLMEMYGLIILSRMGAGLLSATGQYVSLPQPLYLTVEVGMIRDNEKDQMGFLKAQQGQVSLKDLHRVCMFSQAQLFGCESSFNVKHSLWFSC
ncbi:hypothetical protein AOLI_G00040510 [Acnodon oligacanthus]